MAGNEISARIKIDGGPESIKTLQAIGKEAKKIDGETAELEVKVDSGTAKRDIDGLLGKVDNLAQHPAHLLLTSNAVAIEQDIAGLVLKLNTLDDPHDIRVASNQLNTLSGDLDRVTAKIKEVNATDITPRGAETAGAGFQKIVDGADQANSATANMVGNASQDLGNLAGVTGSAGVAVGQLAEYFTDSAFKAKEMGQGIGQIAGSFAKALGPIAGISVAVGIATKLWSDYQAEQKQVAENTAQAAEEIASINGVIDDLNASLRSTAETGTWSDQLLSGLNETQEGFTDILAAAERTGIGVEDLGTVLAALGTDTPSSVPLIDSLMENLGITRDEAEELATAIGNTPSGNYARLDAELAQMDSDLGSVIAKNRDFIDDILKINDVTNQADINQIADDFLQQIQAVDGGIKLVTDARDRLAAKGIVDPENVQVAQEVSRALQEMATSTEAWAKANKPIEDMPKTWQAAANAAHALVTGQELSANQQAAINVLMQAYGLTQDQVLDKGLVLWEKNAEAAKGTGKAIDEIDLSGFSEGLEQLAVDLMGANRALEDMVTPFETIGRNQGALQAVFDIGNAPEVAAGKVRDVKLAIGELDTALEGIDVGAVLAGDISADKFLDAIDAIAPDIQAQIADTFAAAGPGAAIAMANSYIDQVTAELGGKFSREQVAQLLGLEDILVKISVAIDQSTLELARQRLEILAGVPGVDPIWVAEMKLKLQDPTADVTALAAEIDAMLEGAGVEVPIGADTLAAIAKADAAQAYADSLVGTEKFDGEWQAAQDAADAAKAYADSLVAQEKIDADNKAAKDAADAAKEHADALTASMMIGGDASGARTAADAAATYVNNKTATLKITPIMVGFEEAVQRGLSRYRDTGGTVPPGGGIAGEKGPEWVRLPDGRVVLVTGESFIPAGSRVTSTRRTRELLRGGMLPRFADGTGFNAPGGPVDMVWRQILHRLNQITALTQEGNETAADVGKMLAAVDLAEVSEEQTAQITALLGALIQEMASGNKGGQEAIDRLTGDLSRAIGASTLSGIVRLADGTFGPADPAWVRFEDGSFGPVVAAIDAQTAAAQATTPADVERDAIWAQILQTLHELTTVTSAGNVITDEVSQMLQGINLEELGAEEATRIAMLLEALTAEMEKGSEGNVDAIEALKTTLATAIKEAMTPAPGTALEPVAAKPVEVTVKEDAAAKASDPNTAVLEKIAGTLEAMYTFDQASAAWTVEHIKGIAPPVVAATEGIAPPIVAALLGLAQALQVAGASQPAPVRAAAMAIRAGRA